MQYEISHVNTLVWEIYLLLLSRTYVKLVYIPRFSMCLEKNLVLSVCLKILVIKFSSYDSICQDAFRKANKISRIY